MFISGVKRGMPRGDSQIGCRQCWRNSFSARSTCEPLISKSLPFYRTTVLRPFKSSPRAYCRFHCNALDIQHSRPQWPNQFAAYPNHLNLPHPITNTRSFATVPRGNRLCLLPAFQLATSRQTPASTPFHIAAMRRTRFFKKNRLEKNNSCNVFSNAFCLPPSLLFSNHTPFLSEGPETST